MGSKNTLIDKEIYKGIFNFDKKISMTLSFFIIIAGFAWLFLISKGKGGMTGFSVLETTDLGGIGLGVVFFMLLFIAVMAALVNIAYLGKKSRKV